MPYGYHSQGTERRRFSLSYILMPPKYRRLDVIIRTMSYLTIMWLSAASVFLIPPVRYPAIVSVLLGAVALVGSARRRLRVEYGVIWFLAGSVFAQATIMWFLPVDKHSLSYMLAISWTSLFVFIAQRANRLGATSKLMYELRVQEIDALKNNGE